MTDAAAVIDFWFSPETRESWFKPTPAFDDDVRRRLGGLHDQAARGDLADWEASAEGTLALLILLDQVPRNIFRDDKRAFASDPDARAVAGRAIASDHDLAHPVDRRNFYYLPFEHSEDIEDQNRCCAMVDERAGGGESLEWAKRHRAVIERFGRFPHRNKVLGRQGTSEEIDYLESRDTPF